MLLSYMKYQKNKRGYMFRSKFAGAVSTGIYRRPDIQEKYQSGQVEKHERELSDLESAVKEAIIKFDDILEDEKATLKSYLALSDKKASLKKASIEDEKDEFFRLLKLKFSPPNADPLMKEIYLKHEAWFESKMAEYNNLPEDDLDNQFMIEMEIQDYYVEKKDESLDDVKKIEPEMEKVDSEIEKEVAFNVLDSNPEIAETVKEDLKLSIKLDEEAPKKEEEIKEQKREEKVLESLSIGDNGIPFTTVEKLNKWINVKCDLTDPGVKNIVFDNDINAKEELLKDKAKTKQSFVNLVRLWNKKNHKSPSSGENISFAELCSQAVTDEDAEKALSKLLSSSNINGTNWYEHQYYQIQNKVLNGEGLDSYEEAVKELLEEADLTFVSKVEKKKQEIEAEVILKIKVNSYRNWLKNDMIKSISTDSYVQNTTVGGKPVSYDLEKERAKAQEKKKSGEKLDILESYILKAIDGEILSSARNKLRTNKDFMDRIRLKLEKGLYSFISKEEIISINNSIDANQKMPETMKAEIKSKLENKEKITDEEFNLILAQDIEYTRKPLTEDEVNALKRKVDNDEDQPKIESLLKNPMSQIGQYKQEIAEAKRKKTKGLNLTDLERTLLDVEVLVKKKEKENAPITNLAMFISKCKQNDKMMGFLDDVLCKDKNLKSYESNLNKVLHEVYSMLVNESDESIVVRNKDRVIFLFKEAIKECSMRTHREKLHSVLDKHKTDKGLTLLDFLPSNLIVEADSSGVISKMFTMYDNKLSNLEDKINIQEEILEKYDVLKDIIYTDLKNVVKGDPSTDSMAFILTKKKILGLVAAITLETGLRPSPVKNPVEENLAGGKSQKSKMIRDTAGQPLLTDEGKKQFIKEEIETYGVATLKPEHIKFFKTNFEASLKFYGKKGVENISKVSDAEIVKELEKLVSIASGSTGPKSLFILPNGKPITNTDIVVYFENIAFKAGLKKLRITDFRKLKAVKTIHESLLQQQKSLYKSISQIKVLKKEAIKVEITKLVTQVVDKAYKDAQKALSHSKVNETINSYVNPNLLLNFLSSGGVDRAIDQALSKKNTLQFDPEVFLTQALAYCEVDITKPKNEDEVDGSGFLARTLSAITKKLNNLKNLIKS